MVGQGMQRRLLLFAVVLGALSISVSQTASVYVSMVESYISKVKRLESGYRHLVDDAAGMMEIAERFRDLDYNYSPEDMNRVVMRDGVNGTQELLEVFNDLIDLVENISRETLGEGLSNRTMNPNVDS